MSAGTAEYFRNVVGISKARAYCEEGFGADLGIAVLQGRGELRLTSDYVARWAEELQKGCQGLFDPGVLSSMVVQLAQIAKDNRSIRAESPYCLSQIKYGQEGDVVGLGVLGGLNNWGQRVTEQGVFFARVVGMLSTVLGACDDQGMDLQWVCGLFQEPQVPDPCNWQLN